MKRFLAMCAACLMAISCMAPAFAYDSEVSPQENMGTTELLSVTTARDGGVVYTYSYTLYPGDEWINLGEIKNVLKGTGLKINTTWGPVTTAISLRFVAYSDGTWSLSGYRNGNAEDTFGAWITDTYAVQIRNDSGEIIKGTLNVTVGA